VFLLSLRTRNWEEKLMALKQNQANNKQKLASTPGRRPETIAVKGETKNTKVYQVQMVNLQQQKTEVSNQKAQQGGREGRLKKRVVEKKTPEYQQYGQQIEALGKQYTTLDPDRLMKAKQAGNISLTPGQGTVALVVKNV
jgi:hypothetical protein